MVANLKKTIISVVARADFHRVSSVVVALQLLRICLVKKKKKNVLSISRTCIPDSKHSTLAHTL